MPPSRRSSSSRSSSSRSRSSSSRRRSSSSHSSRSRSSYNSNHSSTTRIVRQRHNQPKHVPKHISNNAITLRCKNHDYIYYRESWQDKTGTYYQKGYYDEDGKFYSADDLAFKREDGSYIAHYMCDYCGTELETVWQEGFYPTCKNCSAEMRKSPVYIDDIIDFDEGNTGNQLKKVGLFAGSLIGLSMLTPFIVIIFMIIVFANIQMSMANNPDSWVEIEEGHYQYVGDNYEYSDTNLQIYGTDVYLDCIQNGNTYRICEESDDYDKHLIWDFNVEAYYDWQSDCFLWFNTDVDPYIWQYWYEDIAGSNYYGWMECEGEDWYIEVSDTEWELYTGDTSELWHIENRFD